MSTSQVGNHPFVDDDEVSDEGNEDMILEDEVALSHLSSQLISHGYLTRPLDLISLFSTAAPTSTFSSSLPPLSASTTAEQLPTDKMIRHTLRAARARRIAEDRARDQVSKCLWSMLGARIEATAGLERTATQNRVLSFDLERMESMLRKEKVKRMAAEKEQEGEKARATAANQALVVEQERHRHAKEELTKARNALQYVKTQVVYDQKRRETELNSTLTRLQRLTSDPSSAASSRTTVLNSSLRLKSSLSSSASNSATSAEIVLLEEALDECDRSRKSFERENGDLRELIGEIEEWTDTMGDLRGIQSGGTNETNRMNEASYVPHPHLSYSVAHLSPLIHNRLHHIRTSTSSLISTIDERVDRAKESVQQYLDMELLGRGAEKARRIEVEEELKEAKAMAVDSEMLLRNFTSETFLAGGAASSSSANGIVTVDTDETAVISNAHSLEVRAQEVSSSSLHQSLKEKEIERRAAIEAKRVQDVSSFLSELGIDSPAPVAHVAMTKQKQARHIPTPSAPSASIVSSVRPLAASAATTYSLDTLLEDSFDSPPSPFLSSAPAAPPVEVEEEPVNTALEGILAMMISPPPRPFLPSSTAPTAAPTMAKRTVLGSTQMVGSTTTAVKKKAAGSKSSSASSALAGGMMGPPRSTIKGGRMLTGTGSGMAKENTLLK